MSGVDSGHGTIFMVAVITVVVAVCAAMIGLGSVSVERARAQSIADLVALAAVRSPDEAESVAGANGAHLAALAISGSTSHVTVSVGGTEATAAAEPDERQGP